MKTPRAPRVCETRHEVEGRDRFTGHHSAFVVPSRCRYTRAMGRWYVYLIECRDGSLYTGIATDVDRRYAEHVAGKGARYTRSRPPLRLLARFEHPDRAAASRAEYAIKQLSPARKRALCGLD
jgi:putative endonuclease